MKRAILTGPGNFRIEEAPVPAPAAGEALVRIKAIGICGSDLHLFKEGMIGGIRIEDAGGPFMPGHECMGVVEDAGPGVDRALIGRRVFVEPANPCGKCRWCVAGQPNICPNVQFLGVPGVSGCMREYMAHPARLCEPMPDEISDDVAVLLEPLAIAVYSLDRVAPPPGTAAVVLGAGPIGLTHPLLLARGGISPLIVTDVLDYRLKIARDLGATHTFNPKRDNVIEAVLGLTGGYGADSVFECVGHQDTFAVMGELACPGGRVGVVGIPAVDLMAFKASGPRRKGLDLLMFRRANLTLRRALARTLHERLPLAPLATHHWPMEKSSEAFAVAAEYRDGIVKGIINP